MRRGFLDVADDDDVGGTFPRLQFEPKLPLHSLKHGGTVKRPTFIHVEVQIEVKDAVGPASRACAKAIPSCGGLIARKKSSRLLCTAPSSVPRPDYPTDNRRNSLFFA